MALSFVGGKFLKEQASSSPGVFQEDSQRLLSGLREEVKARPLLSGSFPFWGPSGLGMPSDLGAW